MNCNLCIAYLRDKNKCPGCNFQGKPDSDYFRKCNLIKEKSWNYCSPKCEQFPCQKLKNLNKEYKIWDEHD